MSAPTESNASMALATSELAALRRAIEQARAELARVRADIAQAEGELGSRQAEQILEANEQLVLSAMRVQSEADTAAETAAEALKQASRSAELDVLTGLPNRVLLRDRLAQAISGAKRRDARAALLFLDLNNFKQINDTLGHAAGDQVLKLAASRLAAGVRAADTVSRHGGDEFVILLSEVGQIDDAVAIADKLAAALDVPGPAGQRLVQLTASIGISLYPDDGEDVDTLIERADAAMYHAKRHGLRSFAFRHHPGLSQAGGAGAEVPLQRQAQLQEANEHLVLAALNAQELQAAAEQRQARQMEVLAVVAHELRNPLGPIRNAAALLGDSRADDQLVRRVQGIIEQQVSRVTRLVGDLLDVSRAQAGRFRLVRQPVDLADPIGQAVESCQTAMRTRGQKLEVRVPPGALPVDGDPVRLVQILCNLLDNASKYTPVGGDIRLGAAAAEGDVVLTVTDNGIGITAEALPRIFEPFVQDSHAVGFNGTGLGIGLTVVRALVEAHGGSVVAHSAGSGLGSRFVVTLPSIDGLNLA